jgi:predicted CoA-binding protein
LDIVVAQILRSYDTITVVGASADPAKAAHRVPAVMQRHGWRIAAVNPHGVGNPANARGSGRGSSASMHARTCRR